MSQLKSLNSTPVFAVVVNGERQALASLEENAMYAARIGPEQGEVIRCALVPTPALDVNGVTLWGFFHTDCIHESAAALVSLHITKASAWRAMHRAQWAAWEDLQRRPRYRLRGWPKERKTWFTGRAYHNERSHVAPIVVQD